MPYLKPRVIVEKRTEHDIVGVKKFQLGNAEVKGNFK